jgi:hypothetical protein
MTPSDEDDILHPVYSTTKVHRDFEADIDVPEYPFSEVTASDGVLAFCQERKI